MKLIDAQNILLRFDRSGKTVWTVPELRMVLGGRGPAFRKTLQSLCGNDVLTRVSRGVYVYAASARDRRTVFGEIIATLRHGEYCFEALESAAAEWSIIPQSPLGCMTVMTTGRSGRFDTPYGAVEFVHTQAPRGEIVGNIVRREGFIPIATRDYTVHGLRRCGRTAELEEALATGWMEE